MVYQLDASAFFSGSPTLPSLCENPFNQDFFHGRLAHTSEQPCDVAGLERKSGSFAHT